MTFEYVTVVKYTVSNKFLKHNDFFVKDLFFVFVFSPSNIFQL